MTQGTEDLFSSRTGKVHFCPVDKKLKKKIEKKIEICSEWLFIHCFQIELEFINVIFSGKRKPKPSAKRRHKTLRAGMRRNSNLKTHILSTLGFELWAKKGNFSNNDGNENTTNNSCNEQKQ